MATYGFGGARIPQSPIFVPPVVFLRPFDIYGTEGSDHYFDLWDQTPAPPGWYFSLHLGGGNDFAEGSPSGDRIDGESGNDYLWGGGGKDVLIGGDGNDWLSGGDGADTLKGGFGNDHLEGSYGNDVLDGGPGTDDLWGNEGADTFVIADKDAVDVINDFSVANGDKIDIAALLDNQTNFAGTTAAQAFSQGYLYFVQSGSDTLVYIDPDGAAHSSTTDFAVVQLDGVHAAELASLPFIV